MGSRYGVLRAIGGLYQILAVFALLGALVGALTDSPYPAWVPIVVGVGAAVSWFAAGEAITVLLAIEEQTRKSAKLLEHHVEQAPAADAA
jgi:hypothetical protein